MSITKNKETAYTETATDIRYRLDKLRIDKLRNKENVVVDTVLIGSIPGTDGEVDRKTATLNFDIISANFTATEKTAAKTFFKALERETALIDAELNGETQDTSDVFE